MRWRQRGAQRGDAGAAAAASPAGCRTSPHRAARRIAPGAADRCRSRSHRSRRRVRRTPPAARRCRARRRRCRNADPGFEERIGTRWVVWVGGLTLALGGFFMVRYSIEAGLLGPGVRTILGGLFALALLAAGEWTRRKESISDDRGAADRQYPGDPHRRRHRGGVRHGLRGLCAVRISWCPATAFILLGLVALGTLAAALLHGPALAGLGVAGAFVTPILVSSEQAGLLGALYLSRDRHRRRLRPGAHAAVALACGHHDRVRAAVDLPVPANAGRRWSAPHAFHVIAGFVLAALLVVCGFMFGPPAERRPDRADLVRLARGLSVRRHADRAGELSRRHRA